MSAAALQNASLDAVRALLEADARSWAAQLSEFSALAARAAVAGAQTRRTLALDLAGSWDVGQLTAERWLAEAEWFVEALPLTLSMLASGAVLVHQAKVLLHGTSGCTAEVAQAVEAEVLPAGAGLCPSDLRQRVKRVRLRLESESADPADAERQEAERVASRRTFVKPTDDDMVVAGAVLTPEQGMAWAQGMDLLERRERAADKAAGIVRTAEQRRADLFASLPALVLAGTAADDRWRRAAGLPTAGRLTPAPGEEALFDERPVPPPWACLPEHVAAQVVLNVHVPVSTVLELSQEAGSLERYGPVSAPHVRLVRPHAVRRVMVASGSGRPIAVDDRTTPAEADPDAFRAQVQDMLRPDVIVDADEPQHDPGARLARLVDLRDVHCGGPGCSSTRCDRDHLQPHPAGATSARNLGLLSPRCHSAKHSGFDLDRHPDGSVTWLSPLGRTYDRPGPWQPPAPTALYDPPPVRPRVGNADAPDDDDDEPEPLAAALDDVAPSRAAAPPAQPDAMDDPPF